MTRVPGLQTRGVHRVLTVALANKLARIAWAVLATGEEFRPPMLAAR